MPATRAAANNTATLTLPSPYAWRQVSEIARSIDSRWAMALLALSASDIDVAGMPVNTELPKRWLDEALSDTDVRASAPGHVQARLSRTGEDVVVRGRVVASLVTGCARCLDPVQVSVDAELSLLLKRVSPPHPPRTAPGKASGGTHRKRADSAAEPDNEYEFSSAEADTDTYDGETVVLDAFVREAILLEIPSFPLCSDDCPGIRPAAAPADAASGAPRLDPRLLPLRFLGEHLRPPLDVGVGQQDRRASSRRTVSKKNKE